MRTAWITAAGLILTAGTVSCRAISQPDDEIPATIHGLWGGAGAFLHDSAAINAIIMSNRCTSAALAAPVSTDSAGNFFAEGIVVSATWDGFIGRPARISGTVSGSTLTVEYWVRDVKGNFSEGAAFQLKRGQQPDYDGFSCVV